MANANGKNEGSNLTRLEEWERIKKSIGKESTELQERPQLNDKLYYLWDMFLEIRKGCEKIGYSEIDSYSRVTGIKLTPWECLTMIEVDGAWRNG